MTFLVNDDGALSASDSEEVTLTVGAVNRPPLLTKVGLQDIERKLDFLPAKHASIASSLAR